MSNTNPQNSMTLSVPKNLTINPPEPSPLSEPQPQPLSPPTLEIPKLSLSSNTNIPTFGNIPQSPSKHTFRDEASPPEPVKPSSRRPSLFRSETKVQTLPAPKTLVAKRLSKTFVRNFSVVYPPMFSDLESKEPDSSPTMLKEYKYRRLDSGSVLSDEQVENEVKEAPRAQLSLFGLRTLELQNSHNTSVNESHIHSVKSMTPPVMPRRHEKRKFQSMAVNGWMPYFSQKTHDITMSNPTINTIDSSEDDDPISERRARVRRRLKKGFYATYFMGILFCFKNRVQIYGALRPLEYFEAFEAKKSIVEKKMKAFPLSPTGTFSIIWMFLLIILMILNAFITPIYVSFIESDDEVFYYINLAFDIGFAFDMVLNFITAYYDAERNLVTSFRKIILNYLRLWFWIDIAAILPLDDIMMAIAQDESLSANKFNKLLRLLRFPRLYRMLRIIRLVKVVRLFSGHQSLNRLLKKMNLNIGIMKLLQISVNLLFLNHFVGCFWFLVARLDDFSPDTWVARGNLIEEDVITQYIASLYWVFQTFTTVGYGDIIPRTQTEKIICALWPILSVTVYAFLIGNLGQILSHLDIRSEALTERITAFERFSSQVKLPDFLRQKVRRFFEINHKESICHWADPDEMLKDLPASLKTSLLLFSYYGLINNIKLLQVDANFTAALLVHLKLIKLKDGELLYREEDPPHEVYFISKGAVKFVTESAQGIFSLAEGTYFGEMEILEKTRRACFCQGMGNTVLLVCPRSIFLKTLLEFPDIEAQIQKISQLRKSKIEERLSDMKRTGDTTDRERIQKNPNEKVHFKTTEYINTVLLKIADRQNKENNDDDDDEFDDMGIKMDEEERKEYLRRKKRGESDPWSNGSLGSITERMKKQADSRLSLVERLKKLKTKHGDASKKKDKNKDKDKDKDKKKEKESKSKKSSRVSDLEGDQLHSGNSPPPSSASLLKLSNLMVDSIPTNPECDNSQLKKMETIEQKEPNSATAMRTNTASFSMQHTTQMEELNLLGEAKSAGRPPKSAEKQGSRKVFWAVSPKDSSVNDSRVISFEKGMSIFSTNLSSLIKDKTYDKKILPKSNKIAPIIVSSRGKEGKYINIKANQKPNFDLDNDSGSDSPRK